MVAIALTALLASLAGGVALSAYVASRRETDRDLQEQLIARYAELSADFPQAAPSAARCLTCADGMCDVVREVNDLRAGLPADGDVARAVTELRRAETRDYLSECDLDCVLRRSVAHALQDAAVQDARDTMLALDHVLEAAPELQDARVESLAPPVAVADLLAAIHDRADRADRADRDERFPGP